eukprot:Seg994.4 transcript_id=Seg994.4/GoldUCD/mRNA.D3Y31 product="hypothetical protein" protein_id=Seg994.4/GoldUCD/D3Y31
MEATATTYLTGIHARVPLAIQERTANQTSMNAGVHLVKMEEVAIICKTATPALVHPDIQEQTAKQFKFLVVVIIRH